MTPVKNNVKRNNVDLINAVKQRPSILAVVDTPAKVHQVNSAELYTTEGRKELLNTLHHVRHRHWRGDKAAAFIVAMGLSRPHNKMLFYLHAHMQKVELNLTDN